MTKLAIKGMEILTNLFAIVICISVNFIVIFNHSGSLTLSSIIDWLSIALFTSAGFIITLAIILQLYAFSKDIQTFFISSISQIIFNSDYFLKPAIANKLNLSIFLGKLTTSEILDLYQSINNFSKIDELSFYVENKNLMKELIDHLRFQNTYVTFLKMITGVENEIAGLDDNVNLSSIEIIRQSSDHYINYLIQMDCFDNLAIQPRQPTMTLLWQAAAKVKLNTKSADQLIPDCVENLIAKQKVYKSAGLA